MTALQRFVDHRFFQGAILTLIVINALIMGLQAMPAVKAVMGPTLRAVDDVIMWIFVAEIGLRILAHQQNFFRGGWNLFDFFVVAVSVIASSSGVAAIRALRVLRVLRLVSVFPKLRVVVTALIDSVPGIAAVGLILVLILYIFAILAHQMFGAAHPQWFGNLFTAMFTLFQIMTLESWPDKAAAVMETHPWSWAFFLGFILVATFTLLNLFVAIVVSVLESETDFDRDKRAREGEELRKEMRDLREQVERLTESLEAERDRRR